MSIPPDIPCLIASSLKGAAELCKSERESKVSALTFLSWGDIRRLRPVQMDDAPVDEHENEGVAGGDARTDGRLRLPLRRAGEILVNPDLLLAHLAPKILALLPQLRHSLECEESVSDTTKRSWRRGRTDFQFSRSISCAPIWHSCNSLVPDSSASAVVAVLACLSLSIACCSSSMPLPRFTFSSISR